MYNYSNQYFCTSERAIMKRAFVKMQGLGNDFILFDELAKASDEVFQLNPDLAKRLCDRRLGIGADGVFVLSNAADQDEADIAWDFYNSNGKVAEMCGNAIRCVARYVYDNDLWPMPAQGIKPVVIVGEDGDLDIDSSDVLNPEVCCGKLKIKTLAGIISVELIRDDEDSFIGARVDLGKATEQSDVVVNSRNFSRIYLGTPHAITFVNELPSEFSTPPVTTEGPVVENDPLFPEKTNVEFAEIVNEKLIKLRVWERNNGETMACGTGAAATAVAAYKKGLVGNQIQVQMNGGILSIDIQNSLRVYMTGPAEMVFTGAIDLT